MRAVWMVLSHRLTAQFAFLLVIAGYNPRKDRSFNDRLYLIYVIIFFSIWIFMVLTLFADWAVKILTVISPLDIRTPAVIFLLAILLLWNAYQLWLAAKTSPFVFTEEDGALLCATPVSRRAVAIQWFFHKWIMAVLPFAGIAVVLGFAQVEWQFQGDLGILDFPIYAGAGLRAMFSMTLAHLLVQALVWLFGLLRLRSDRDIRHYRWVAVAIITLFAVTALRIPAVFSVLTAPWRFALEHAMGGGLWFSALLSAGLPALIVLGLLVLWSDRLNLSRAAQETAYHDQMQAAMRLGDMDLVTEIKTKKRLGSGHAPSKLPFLKGGASILSRKLLQSLRVISLGSIGRILLVFVSTVAIYLAPDRGSWILVLAGWTLLLGQLGAEQLRSSLKNWWLWTQQPFRIQDEILWQVLPTGLLVTIVAWLGLLIIPIPNALMMALIMPFSIITVMLAGIIDVLRQVRSELLVVERVPVYSVLGTLFGMALLVLPFWFYLQPLTATSYFQAVFWGVTENIVLWLLIGTIWKNRK